MADYWLNDKQLVHKLFKVLTPRFENFPLSYTRMHKAPREYPGPEVSAKRVVLELRGNPYPPVKSDFTQNRNLIHNVLLDEAKKQYRQEKYMQIAAKLTSSTVETKLDESVVVPGTEKSETSNSNQENEKNVQT